MLNDKENCLVKTGMEEEKELDSSDADSRWTEMEIEAEATSQNEKADLRKFNSGRKPKTLEKIMTEYRENIPYKGWLESEEKESSEGESQIFWFCSWCRAENKNT